MVCGSAGWEGAAGGEAPPLSSRVGVVNVILPSNNLTGVLPTTLGALRHMQQLYAETQTFTTTLNP